MNNITINKYYVKNNYPGLEKLYKILERKKPGEYKKKDIKNFLDAQETTQLTKAQNKTSAQGHIISFEPNEIWQLDIYVMKKYDTYNKNYGYMLAVVDVFTRKASVKKMKNKDSNDCSEALKDIINEFGTSPKIIMSDNDKAYSGESFQSVLDKYNIILDENVVGDHNALGIIDRFARTLKTIITSHFIYNKTKNWIDPIDGIVKKYNKTDHKALGYLTPKQAGKTKYYEEILQLNVMKSQKNKTVSDLKPEDKVRVKISGIFSKGTEPKWSDEFYNVIKINGTTITLSNDKRYKRTNLLKIPNETLKGFTNPIKDVTKNNKGKQIRKKEDIQEENIVREKRATKKPNRFND